MVTRDEHGNLLIATVIKRRELAEHQKSEAKLDRQLNAIAIIGATIVIIGALLGGISN